MDTRSVQMGGILDLATTQSDIFIMKSNNGETSPEAHENMYHHQEYTDSKKTEAWNDYDDNFYNKQEMNASREFNEYTDAKTSSPDALKQTKHNKDQPSDLPLHTSGPMIWSVCSSVAETPGDSGVQCLDSETSDLTSDCPAGMTLSLVEAEELACDTSMSCEPQSKVESSFFRNKAYIDTDVMTQSDIENQNVTDISCNNEYGIVELPQSPCSNKPKSMEAVKSASDDIVFRRKCKKKTNNQSQPKKRVSFHEDILNNTKTDNIHIEHGFISYRPEISMNYFQNNYVKKLNGASARYSWCAVGDSPFAESQHISNRNTRSDVLTYGGTDVTGYPDNSGIYEYDNDDMRYFNASKNKPCESETCINKIPPCKCSKDDSQKSEGNSPVNRQLYMCSCSSSDSNLSSESETSSSQTLSLGSDTRINSSGPSKKCDNTQKSYSCDCIENNMMKPLMKTMYFSDANINNHSDKGEQLQMSEILPKQSCLKKSALKKKRYITTDVIEEHESSKNKTESDKIMRSLLDSKNLFGSLKNIYKNINFGLSIAERGVPEGSEDCQSVSEVLPTEPVDNETSFLSKSFDTGTAYNFKASNPRKGDGFSRNYVHEVDNHLRRKGNQIDDYASQSAQTSANPQTKFNDLSKQNLSLDMNASSGKPFLDWKSQGNLMAKEAYPNSKSLRNKYIVNCESTVYEHKGVSYCYEYDTFQTTFDTSKDTFTPITDTLKVDGNSSQVDNKSIPNAEESKKLTDHKSTMENSVTTERENDDCVNSSIDLTTENDTSIESGDKSKFRLSRYFADPAESGKSGVSKHLSSPLKQRNIMRYEKVVKPVNSIEHKDNDQCFDNNSTQDTFNESGDLDEILEISDGFDMNTKVFNRKTSLINRFLKNVSQKKMFYSKLKENEFFQSKIKEESLKFPNICFPSTEKISPTFKQSAKYLDTLINKEVMENKRISVKLMTADEPSYFDSFEENVAIECCEKLKLELFRNSSEVLHRMLKVRSIYAQENGQWSPQLVFITDRALYVAEVQHGKSSYNLLCYLTHDKLNMIVIGPDSQYVQIFDNSGDCKCILITGDRYLCHRLVSSLEWSSRNCRTTVGSVTVCGSIPSVLWKDRECLRKSLLKSSPLDKYERCVFYGMVGSSAPASFNMGRPASPFGLTMEGFLMYKREKQRNWKPSFFLLKSGVLSYGSSTPKDNFASCLPHSIELKTVVGVRRCTDIHGRPYCFEIALGHGAGILQMAAPDDDIASQWLQGLLMHAAQALEGPKADPSKKILPPCCTLLATSRHIITLREELEIPRLITNGSTATDDKQFENKGDAVEQFGKDGVEILSFASIKDLTALKIPDNDDNWCILEFVFCEVHEGTEMGFLFGSSAELERFIATVESLWHTTNEGVFPISILLSTDSTSRKCSEWHNRLVTAWERLLPTAQR
ncbi:pleckstrin homology domain-containing protein pruning defect 1 [Arctopsyche grandis]|uniref:pleckstrin homology domain-containing protein pruning defect 1 n=1 Tax=Arctopsyche grandis TaxID=121162 RepID=UPI00406D8EA9